MAYLGIGPASFTNNLTNVQILDDISSGFGVGGTPTTFNLTANSVPFQAVSDRALMVILGGVIQAPGVDYTINGSQITFTTAPLSGLTFYARNIYGLNALNGVNDGIVGPYSLTTGGPSWDTSGNTTISGNLTVQGATTTIQSTTLDVIDKDIKLASNQSNNVGIDTAGLLWGTTAVKLKYYNNGGTNPGLNIEGTNVGIGVTAPTAKLDVDGDVKFTGVTSGRDVLWDKSADELKVKDNTKISFGTDRDLQLSHNNSDSVISHIGSATGNLKILSGGAQSIECVKAGAVNIAHNGTTRLATTNAGVAITGEGTFSGGLFADSDLWMVDQLRHTGDTNTAIRFPAADTVSVETAGDERLRVTATGEVNIGDTSNNTWIDSTLKVRKDQNAVTKIAVRNENQGSSASSAIVVNAYGNSWMFDCGSAAKNSNALTIRLDATAGSNQGTEKLKIDTSGHITPGAADTQDLGSTSKEFRNLYLGDSGRLYVGSGQEASLYHNGSNTYFKGGANAGLMSIEGQGNVELFAYSKVLIRVNAGESAIICNNNNSVDLYYDASTYSSPKLKTSHTGITVDGEIVSSQDYPTVRPTLDLNFVATNKLDSRVKFFRNSHATYIDKNGIVRIVGNNVPRFDHDPETKECLGLLMEGESSSRLTQSSHNNTASTYHQIRTDNYYKGPDDIENSAREYIHNGTSGSATGGSTTVWANQAVGMANPVSISCFVKITRGASMRFQLLDNNNGLNSHHFDLSGGYISDGSYATVVKSDPGSTDGTNSYQRFPNGWVKIKWENISGSANTSSYIQLYMLNHATSTASNPVGYAIWGFQVENEAFCTSTIIKTSTSVAQVREREVAIIEKKDFADFWNPLEGTAYVDALMPNVYGNSGIPAYSFKHTVNTGYSIAFLRDNGSSPVYHFFNDGAGVTARSAAASDSRYRSALAFKEADINGAVNGVAGMNQTSAFTMQKFDYMYLGSLNSANNDLHGHIKRFTYYPKKLSDNQLLNITS